MLLGPAVALLWFVVVPPATADAPLPGTFVVAAALVAGAALTGATQIRPGWRFAGTLGAGLFGALLTVLFAAVLSSGRSVGLGSSPAVGQGFAAALAGLGGTLAAATLMPALARVPSRVRRSAVPAAIGVAVAALCVRLVFSL
jgi:hypothetical protein